MFFYNLGNLWGFLRQSGMNSGFGSEKKVLDYILPCGSACCDR